MEELGGEAPFLSQKQLKHVLVGVEKLVKTWAEQKKMIESGIVESEVIAFVNQERNKCGLAPRQGLLTIDEMKAHDSKMFELMEEDIVTILQYVKRCEARIIASIAEWLNEAEDAGLLAEHRGDNQTPYRAWLSFAVSHLVKTPEFLRRVLILAQELTPIDEEIKKLLNFFDMED